MIIMRTVVIGALAGALLSGCFTPITWERPGATQVEWERDSNECKLQALQAAHNNAFIAYDAIQWCMQARGYRKVDPNDPRLQAGK